MNKFIEEAKNRTIESINITVHLAMQGDVINSYRKYIESIDIALDTYHNLIASSYILGFISEDVYNNYWWYEFNIPDYFDITPIGII